jgi:hypothetical protein
LIGIAEKNLKGISGGEKRRLAFASEVFKLQFIERLIVQILKSIKNFIKTEDYNGSMAAFL